MKLPRIQVVDDALSAEELARWRDRLVRCKEQSTPCDVDLGELVNLARSIVGDIDLIHAPMFAIRAGQDPTELHRDLGEYAVIFYSFDCPSGPLRIDPDVELSVRANRVVAFDATVLLHQQVIPNDGSTRYSVALKFRRPEV